MAHNDSSSTSDTQDAKIGFFGRIAMFIRQVIAELKKVIWPTRNELSTYFAVVVVFVAALMVIVGLFDFAFSSLTRWIFA